MIDMGKVQVISFKISIVTDLDSTDMRILSIFQSSRKSWTASQIKTLLDYQGISVSPSSLRERLKRLVTLSILSSERGSRVFRYRIQHFITSSAQM